MSDRAWKAFERRLARQLGTQRIPVTGERAGADFTDGMFAYQAKLFFVFEFYSPPTAPFNGTCDRVVSISSPPRGLSAVLEAVHSRRVVRQ